MRLGQYAIYKGTEYRFNETLKRKIRLVSDNVHDISNGFVQDSTGELAKIVERDEIESAYSIDVYCRYKGYDFYIVEEKGDKVVIGNSKNESLVNLLQMDYIERGFYTKMVDKDEITEVVEKKNIYWENKV